jgi:hypothetical protein
LKSCPRCVKIADGFPGEDYEILTLITKYY